MTTSRKTKHAQQQPNRPIVVEIFYSVHCPACSTLRESLTEILTELPDRDVMLVDRPLPEHLDRAVTLKIVQTPAIVAGERPPLVGTVDKNQLAEYIFRSAEGMNNDDYW